MLFFVIVAAAFLHPDSFGIISFSSYIVVIASSLILFYIIRQSSLVSFAGFLSNIVEHF
jgi:hypothetical protein